MALTSSAMTLTTIPGGGGGAGRSFVVLSSLACSESFLDL